MSAPLPGSAGPLDIAMDEARHDPRPGNPARVLLEEQSRLLREQTALARHERLRSRIRMVRDAILTAVAAAVVLFIAFTVWDASRSRATVFEALSVPPAVAQTGLTGEAAANRLLDQMDAMQTSVGIGSGSQRRASVGARDDMRVQIPQTGLSLGELLRLLR